MHALEKFVTSAEARQTTLSTLRRNFPDLNPLEEVKRWHSNRTPKIAAVT